MLPSEIRVKLANNVGEDIQVQSISITSDASPSIACISNSTPVTWVQATNLDFAFTSCTGGAYLPDQRIEVKISMDYFAINSPSHPLHKINGKIDGKVTT